MITNLIGGCILGIEMPHCDAINGPVVLAAKKAVETGNINYVLIWIPRTSEEELKEALEKTLAARSQGEKAKEVAEYWFWETCVRLHRVGEGEGFSGLKPEGLIDPIVEKAEKAIKQEDAHEFIEVMEDSVEDVLEERFKKVLATKNYDVDDVEGGRKFIEAYINFVVFSHHLYGSLSKNHELEDRSKHEH